MFIFTRTPPDFSTSLMVNNYYYHHFSSRWYARNLIIGFPNISYRYKPLLSTPTESYISQYAAFRLALTNFSDDKMMSCSLHCHSRNTTFSLISKVLPTMIFDICSAHWWGYSPFRYPSSNFSSQCNDISRYTWPDGRISSTISIRISSISNYIVIARNKKICSRCTLSRIVNSRQFQAELFFVKMLYILFSFI